MLELVAPFIVAPAISSFLNCSPVICVPLIFFAYAFNNGVNILMFNCCIMPALFCLKANSKANNNMAPMANETSVAVTPDARYLFNTIITNNAGAKAQIAMIKLLINSIMAVVLSRNRCRRKLVIICVFN